MVLVSANIETLGKHLGVDGGPMQPANDAILLNLRFANGAFGSIQLSAMTHIGDLSPRPWMGMTRKLMVDERNWERPLRAQ